MKTALLLFPKIEKEYNQQEYITACINRVVTEGYFPICPTLIENTSIIKQEYIDHFLPYVDTIYMFVNFGLDQSMFQIIERIGNKKEIVYRTIQCTSNKIPIYTPKQILKDVADKFGMTVVQLCEKTNKRKFVEPRFIYFYRARRLTNANLRDIGKLVGKDHASVLHGIRQIQVVAELKKLYIEKYQTIPQKIEPEKPILPFRLSDPRERNIPPGDIFLKSLVGIGFNAPYMGYKEHSR
jgi:hypothetical protein